MRPLIVLLLMCAAFSMKGQDAFAQSRTPVASSEVERYYVNSLTLSLENGFGGILSIECIAVVPDDRGRRTYVLFTNPKEFVPFAGAVSESANPVIADLDGTGISVRLTATATGSRLFGQIVETNERVIVVPAKDRRLR